VPTSECEAEFAEALSLLELSEPPKYHRQPAGSQVEGFAPAIAAMLLSHL